MKQPRGVTGRESSSSSSACRPGPDAFPVPKSVRVDVNREAGEGATRKRAALAAAPPEMARVRRCPGVEFSGRKRIKVTHDAAGVEMVVFAAAVKNARDSSLKMRLAAELDALRELVKKAEALSGGNRRFVAAEPRRLEKAPSPKRIKTSPLVEKVDAPQMAPAECGGIKIVDPEEEIDICGGVSPVVVIRDTSPLIPDEGVESPAAPAALPPKENATPEPWPRLPEPASEAVQSTEPESDSYESVSSRAPSAVLPMKIDSPAQAPKPASLMAQPQSAKVQGNQPISVLLARAKEAYEIRQQKGNGWEREKVRREVREMEKAVLPDETIHPRDLEDVGIAEFGYVLHQLGVFLRPDVY